MKKFLNLFFVSTLILFMSCNGEDHEFLVDDYCYFQPQLFDWDGDCNGEITFTVQNTDTFETYEWSYEWGDTAPVIAIPKNACYTLEVTSPEGCILVYTVGDSYLELFGEGHSDSIEFCLGDFCSAT